jgi:hypothetical protein
MARLAVLCASVLIVCGAEAGAQTAEGSSRGQSMAADSAVLVGRTAARVN